jgi:molecular chaperone GrpE
MSCDDEDIQEQDIKNEDAVDTEEEPSVPEDDYENKWKRALADLDNMRKRTDREMESLKKFASEQLILDVLRSMEDFERAIATSKVSKPKLMEGLEMILEDLKNMMDRYGVTVIDSVGSTFDSSLHEAVLQSSTDREEDDNTVIEELQRGYKLHDKVIRHAKVKVAKHEGG